MELVHSVALLHLAFAVVIQRFARFGSSLLATSVCGATGIPGAVQNVNLTPVVGLDVFGVGVVSATYLPGSVGVYLVQFTIPSDFPVTGPDKNLSIGQTVNGQTVFGKAVLIGGIQ